MKKFSAVSLCAILCVISLFSCMDDDDNNTNLTLSENEHYYSMNAHFSRSKTRRVEKYMDMRIGKKSNTSFVNSRIDGTIALDDHTTFYMKKYPGFLEIKLNKNENSYEAYQRVKSMCEGIKNGLK